MMFFCLFFFCRTFSQNCRNIELLSLNGCTKITDRYVHFSGVPVYQKAFPKPSNPSLSLSSAARVIASVSSVQSWSTWTLPPVPQSPTCHSKLSGKGSLLYTLRYQLLSLFDILSLIAVFFFQFCHTFIFTFLLYFPPLPHLSLIFVQFSSCQWGLSSAGAT